MVHGLIVPTVSVTGATLGTEARMVVGWPRPPSVTLLLAMPSLPDVEVGDASVLGPCCTVQVTTAPAYGRLSDPLTRTWRTICSPASAESRSPATTLSEAGRAGDVESPQAARLMAHAAASTRSFGTRRRIGSSRGDGRDGDRRRRKCAPRNGPPPDSKPGWKRRILQAVRPAARLVIVALPSTQLVVKPSSPRP